MCEIPLTTNTDTVSKVDLLVIDGEPEEGTKEYEVYSDRIAESDNLSHEDDVVCDLCGIHEALVSGMLNVNDRWFAGAPLCEICAVNLNKVDWEDTIVDDPTDDFETPYGDVLQHIDSETKQEIINRTN